MTARIVTNEGAREVSDREFYTRVFGHPPRTRAEREAEWRAECERHADAIERGGEWAVPPPYLWEARRIVAERRDAPPEDQLTEVRADPLKHIEPRRVA